MSYLQVARKSCLLNEVSDLLNIIIDVDNTDNPLSSSCPCLCGSHEKLAMPDSDAELALFHQGEEVFYTVQSHPFGDKVEGKTVTMQKVDVQKWVSTNLTHNPVKGLFVIPAFAHFCP